MSHMQDKMRSMGRNIMNAAQERAAYASANSATQNGYTGKIQNNEAPQMDLMSQMKMYQQYKGGNLMGGRNAMGGAQSITDMQYRPDAGGMQKIGAGFNPSPMEGARQPQSTNLYQQAQPEQPTQPGLGGFARGSGGMPTQQGQQGQGNFGRGGK